jgi:hypothetical protein
MWETSDNGGFVNDALIVLITRAASGACLCHFMGEPPRDPVTVVDRGPFDEFVGRYLWSSDANFTYPWAEVREAWSKELCIVNINYVWRLIPDPAGTRVVWNGPREDLLIEGTLFDLVARRTNCTRPIMKPMERRYETVDLRDDRGW